MIKRTLTQSVFFIMVILAAGASCSSPADDPKVTDGDVVINEISPAQGEDWIELYNDSDVTVDLTNFRIYDDATRKYTLPSGTTIAPRGFLVLICDDLGSGLNTNFRLSSQGESVFLENNTGQLIDRVDFPPLNDGQSYARFPDAGTFQITGNTTRNATNGAGAAPAFKLVSRTPLVPALNQAVTVRAEFNSLTGISSVKLYYRFNGASFTSINMTLSGSQYTANIPASAVTGRMDYYLEAVDGAGRTARAPFDAPADSYAYLLNTDVLPNLFINEFLAYNSSCCADNSSGTAEFDDWFEIYNAGDAPVNVAGMYVSDNKANPFKYKIPTTNPSLTTIPAKGFLVVWADEQGSQGELHASFQLSNLGEDIGIYYIDGRTINEYTFGAQSENISWGRTTNGAATWRSFNTPTPGATNN